MTVSAGPERGRRFEDAACDDHGFGFERALPSGFGRAW